MRKRVFTLALVSWALLGYQAMAHNEKDNESTRIDFEDGSVVIGEDIKDGYETTIFEIEDNPVAEDNWDGEGSPKDELNSSASCLRIERAENTAEWAGPVIRLPQPVTVSAQDPTTHFLHIQALLPEGVTEGKGKFVINAYGAGWDNPTDGDRYLHDNSTGVKDYPKDAQAMKWYEFHYDLRSSMGKTFTTIQLQPERGGSLVTYVDNIVINNEARDPEFKPYDFGTPVEMTNMEGCYIFMPGTKYCITSADPLAIGQVQTSFAICNEDAIDYQLWNIELTGEKEAASQAPLFTISDFSGTYLQNDGKLYDEDPESFNQKWFATKMTVMKDGEPVERTFFINAASYTWLGMGEVMEDLECVSSTDSAMTWQFMTEDEAAAYMASAASDKEFVKTQVGTGDYYIFYAGTNYCATDPRYMEWVKNDFEGDNGHIDSMWVPQHSVDQGYPVELREFKEGDKSQIWTIRNYAEDVDMEHTHTFFDVYDAKENGFYPLKTERWHWSANADSTTRAVGARLITGQVWYPECQDSTGTAFTFPYQPIWGDNGKMNSHKNDQKWFVKRLVYNEDGMVAMYRPNNGVQGTFLSANYDGAMITAHANDQVGTFEEESTMYVWNFVKYDEDAPLTAEQAKAFIRPDTIFGKIKAIEPGEYRIVYKGTNMAMTSRNYLDENGVIQYQSEVEAYNADSVKQVWTVVPVTDATGKYAGYSDMFQLKDAHGNYYYAEGTNHYNYPKSEAVLKAMGLWEQTYLQALTVDGSEYIFFSDPELRKYLEIWAKTNPGTVYTTNWGPTKYSWELVPANEEVKGGVQWGSKHRIEPGYYYIQAAYSYDTTQVDGEFTDISTPWVLTPNATTPLVNDLPNVMQKYNADSLYQTWYITYTDTTYHKSTQKDTFDIKNDIDARYFLFASNSIADTMAKGATDYDLITIKDSVSFVFNDWNKVSPGKNFTWFTHNFYMQEGKIAIKEANHARWFGDYVAPKAGTKYTMAANTNNGTASGAVSDGDFYNHQDRAYVWYLIPVPVDGSAPAFKPVEKIAPWLAEYLPETDEEVIEAIVPSETLDCVTVEGKIITVNGQEGATVKVTSIDGRALKEIKSAAEVESIAVSAAGAYIVTVDGKSAVVMVY